MIEKLIRCTQCNQVIPCYESFGDFGDSSTLPGVEWSPEDMNNQRDFFRLHRDHDTEQIFVDHETFISDKPCFEPNKVSYFEATNGREIFLIRRSKNLLAQPAFYEIIPGRLRVSNISFQIQENNHPKQFSKQNGCLTLNEEMGEKPSRHSKKNCKALRPNGLLRKS